MEKSTAHRQLIGAQRGIEDVLMEYKGFDSFQKDTLDECMEQLTIAIAILEDEIEEERV